MEEKQMNEVTYGQLDKVLHALGFSDRIVERDNQARVYEHADTGAMVAFPVLPDRAKVLPHHLVAVRGTLDQFGIASPLTSRTIAEGQLNLTGVCCNGNGVTHQSRQDLTAEATPSGPELRSSVH